MRETRSQRYLSFNFIKHKLKLIMKLGILKCYGIKHGFFFTSYFNTIHKAKRFGLPVKKLNELNVFEIKSARGSDLFAYLLQLRFPQIPKFYVEFGALDGLTDSQSYLLEKIGWSGILAEPNPNLFKGLATLRGQGMGGGSTVISDRLVWIESESKLTFRITQDPGYSTIKNFALKDRHSALRATDYTEIDVLTISLEDLLKKSEAPNVICYLAIDTEGSEYRILSSFNFNSYKIIFLTVEHNNTPEREKILRLLEKNSYRRIMFEYDSGEDSFIDLNLLPMMKQKTPIALILPRLTNAIQKISRAFRTFF